MRTGNPDAGGVGEGRALAQGVLTVFAWLVVVLMLAIVVQVFGAAFDINPIVAFGAEWPLVGAAVTLNSLLDFQWHLLAVIALLPAGLVWLRDGHVRVDFLYSELPVRWKAAIEIVGHLIFTAPFLALSIPAAWAFMNSAYMSGQGSRNDGLNDLFLIKAVLPLGLALLVPVLVVDFVRQVRRLR